MAKKVAGMETSRSSNIMEFEKKPDLLLSVGLEFATARLFLIEMSNRPAITLGMLVCLICLLTGCSTVGVDLDYERGDLIAPIEQDAAKIRVGQFSDRRGQKSHWLGEIRGEYHYPKSILETNRPVSQLVRDIVEQGADDRGMLGGRTEPPTYQLYGQIVRLDGVTTEPAIVHAHLVVRLFDLDQSEDVYVADHRIDHVEIEKAARARSPFILGNFVEDALNQAVADALEDPELRAILVAAGAES